MTREEEDQVTVPTLTLATRPAQGVRILWTRSGVAYALGFFETNQSHSWLMGFGGPSLGSAAT